MHLGLRKHWTTYTKKDRICYESHQFHNPRGQIHDLAENMLIIPTRLSGMKKHVYGETPLLARSLLLSLQDTVPHHAEGLAQGSETVQLKLFAGN